MVFGKNNVCIGKNVSYKTVKCRDEDFLCKDALLKSLQEIKLANQVSRDNKSAIESVYLDALYTLLLDSIEIEHRTVKNNFEAMLRKRLIGNYIECEVIKINTFNNDSYLMTRLVNIGP